jgi:hypothetical protein
MNSRSKVLIGLLSEHGVDFRHEKLPLSLLAFSKGPLSLSAVSLSLFQLSIYIKNTEHAHTLSLLVPLLFYLRIYTLSLSFSLSLFYSLFLFHTLIE